MLFKQNSKQLVCGIVVLSVLLAVGGVFFQKKIAEENERNRMIMEKKIEERNYLKEETLSYKHFVRDEIYHSERLGKVTPDTSFAPDGQIISHGGKTGFDREYVKNENEMGYVLYTPTCVEEGEELPLIVYLHGAGEMGKSVKAVEEVGLPNALSHWSFDGFHAYVLCPQNPGGYWQNQEKKESVMALVERICKDYPVNPEKVSIVGHSSGGGGALYINARADGYFCAIVPISAVESSSDHKNLNGAKMRTYLAIGDGEGRLKRNFEFKLKPVAGEDQSFVINSTHLNSGGEAFEEDRDCDGKSDLIEWLLSQDRV